MASKEPLRYRYRRQRADGTVNETASLVTFEGWAKKEGREGDRYFVARCEWAEVDVDELVPFGAAIAAHFTYVREVTVVDNGP